MNKKAFLLAIPLALGASLMAAAPASAKGVSNGSNIRAEIRQVDRQIGNIRGLSNREEAQLERRVDNLQRLQQRYSRGGYNRTELRRLNAGLVSIKADIRSQSRDGNRNHR